jgi:hypothetical protein
MTRWAVVGLLFLAGCATTQGRWTHASGQLQSGDFMACEAWAAQVGPARVRMYSSQHGVLEEMFLGPVGAATRQALIECLNAKGYRWVTN